ncbi:putative oxidoreductase [Granulicella aggregans]|uniref:Putative oxidoreductase n=1 Tax=Granulicella aggregans TaxID=474949 RepID=A0A7W7ZG85_9BACT|nr:SDR family NAD(P)-dependent oxidoreductase [Granulicella aggregans]MBB5059303.1 putative oxidoreductase [Granulicella aggregans]
MNISGNTILVTGGTSGIGRALAEALHSKGNRVIIAGRRQALLDEVTGRNPGMVGIAVDLSDTVAIAKFAESVKRQFPELNVLVNNAGIAGLEDYTAESIDLTRAYSTIQTNITGVVQLSAALLPTLRAQPKSTLIVTTSGLAFVPFPPGPVYSATKAFMHNWLDAIRVQLKKTSVEVLELAPPYVQTELGGPQQASDPRAMPLEDYTSEVIQILESNDIEKGEILVQRVKPLRTAERDGKYQEFLDMFAGMHDE